MAVGARALTAAVVACAVAMAVGALASRGSDLRLPSDRVFNERDSPAPVVFSHARHVAFTDNRCLPCHPQPFSILGRHRPVLHEEMDAGGSCGVCHNGREATAFGVDDGAHCEKCHAAERGGA